MNKTSFVFTVLALAVGLPPAGGAALQKGENRTSNQDFLNSVTRGDLARVKELLKQEPALARATSTDGVSALLKAL